MPLDIDLILSCLRQSWILQVGNDHPLGWTITAGYATAAILAVAVALRGPFADQSRARERLFWVLVALFMAFMAINKQLNLQTTLHDVGRCLAQAEGWYETRGGVQRQFVLWLAGALVLTALAMLWWMRKALLRNLPALVGCALLAVFIVVRAADTASVHREALRDLAVSALRVELRLILWNIARTRGSEGCRWIAEGSIVCAPESIG